MKRLSIILLISYSLACQGQDELDAYLKDHHYAFSIDSGFNRQTTEILKQKMSKYRLFICGEGGSHYLQFYEPLLSIWTRFLNQQFGMTRFFLETGHSADVLFNYYLQTGDSSHLHKPRSARTNNFLARLRSYQEKLTPLGIDFERPNSYLKALKLLLPKSEPPQNINTAITLIKTSADTINNCDYILSINKKLKKAIESNLQDFKNYLQENFEDFEWIVMNNGNCLDVYKNRNGNMAKTLLRFHKKYNDRYYFAQLGMAHTLLNTASTASILNRSPEFKDQVCIINTYCYSCATNVEAVSNWQLRKIEKEILDKLLKYCDSDLTLFDFTEASAATKKFMEFGQFLIIAKNQR